MKTTVGIVHIAEELLIARKTMNKADKRVLLSMVDGPEGIEIYESDEEGVVDWANKLPALYLTASINGSSIKLGPFSLLNGKMVAAALSAEPTFAKWQKGTFQPCPFCGSNDIVSDNLGEGDDWFVSCRSCEIQQIAKYVSEAAAIQAWNLRVYPSSFSAKKLDSTLGESAPTPEPSVCPTCAGTGAVDSGGVTPWMAAIEVRCGDCDGTGIRHDAHPASTPEPVIPSGRACAVHGNIYSEKCSLCGQPTPSEGAQPKSESPAPTGARELHSVECPNCKTVIMPSANIDPSEVEQLRTELEEANNRIAAHQDLRKGLVALQRKIKEQCIRVEVRRSGQWTRCICGGTLKAPEGVRNVTLGHASDCLVRDVMEEARP